MRLRRLIEGIRRAAEQAEGAADVNVVVAANVGESGTRTTASRRQTVVQRSRATAASAGTDDGGGHGEEDRRRPA